MYFDTAMVLAGGLGTALAFGLFRLYMMWRRWSNSSKENDEINWDKKIADAIKQGDVELIAQLRKYFLTYKRSRSTGDCPYAPGVLHYCKAGPFWFMFTKDGRIEIVHGDSLSLKVDEILEDGTRREKLSKRFLSVSEMWGWIRSNYKVSES